MKKIIAVLSAFAMIIPFMRNTDTEAFNFPLTSQINSESAIVVNLDSSLVIHEKNADMKEMPGALVNIMTAVIVLENCKDMSEEITVDSSVYDGLINSEYASDLRYADIYNGDVLTVSDLLYAMMLTSSVEAAQTLAYHFGEGDIEKFVGMMNDKAAQIGCTSTTFTNATGMYDDNQYTTARDMATLTEYALGVSIFETISTTQSYNPSVPNFQNREEHSTWVWTHSNLMMDEESDFYYRGAKGIKTGNLDAAGRNLVAMASKDGNNYLIVTLKAPMNDAEGESKYYHLDDGITLFDWAFDHFSYKTLLAASEEIAEVPVDLADGSDYVLLRPKEEFSALWYDGVDTSLIKKDIEYETNIQAPVSKGQKLGTVHLKYSGEELVSADLVAVSDVKRSTSKYNLYAAKRFKNSEWFSKALIISSILSALYILICLYSFICYKNNSKAVKPFYAVPKMNKKNKKK